MVHIKSTLTVLAFLLVNSLMAQHSKLVDPFKKIIISPYIQVEFVQGEEERVSIESCTVDPSKLMVEVNDETLRIYLEGAKETPQWNNNSGKKYDEGEPLYHGTVVKATVTFKRLSEVSLRGDEEQYFKGKLTATDFRLKIYGNSEVIFDEVDMDECHATLYGENKLLMKKGTISAQQFTVYGNSTVDCIEIGNRNTKLTTYGEAEYYVNASKEIKMTLFGEANLFYKGNAVISKGLNFGEMKMERLD